MKAPLWSILATWLLTAASAQEAVGTPPPTTVRFEGKIVAYDGTPIAGAAIAVADGFDLDTPALLNSPELTTDELGRFAVTATKPVVGSLDALYLHVAKKGMASVMRPLNWNDPELGNIVLTTGQRLFGRVRDADGRPLAGVRITAKDLLEQGAMFRSGSQSNFHCAATSGDSGIFQLPCALSPGARLELHADGFARTWLEPVAAGTPLEITMRASGWIQGRVLDEDGRGIEDAKVTVNYELRSASRPVLTGADGSFRVPLDRLGRWRITAQESVDDRLTQGHSEVMTGARENLEIIAVAAEAPGAFETKTFTVTAVTKENARPVPAFRAVALWEQYANRNTSYREYRFRLLLRSTAETAGNTAEIPGPAKNGSGTGMIRAIAEGFAPATVKDVEWQDLEDQDARPVVIEFAPEATVRGIVRDEGTGKPVAGARVRARLKPGPNESQYPDNDKDDGVTTGVDGAFELKGLGDGIWNLRVEDDKHPWAPATEIELGAAEQRAGVEITLPSGAVVAGKLEGIEVGDGARVFLAAVPRQAFGGARFYGGRGSQTVDHSGIAVAPDGSFVFEGIALGNHQLVVRLPSKPRLGGDIFLPIEPFRVRSAGINRAFDCREDQPGAIRGKIQFSNAQTAFEHLVVVAQIVANGQVRISFSPFNQRYPGPRSFVGRDGRFEIRVGPGNYQLTVVDLQTSVALHYDAEKVSVATGKSVERDLTLSLAEIELTLTAAADVVEMATVERVEVRFVPKALEQGARGGSNEQYDSKTGIYWPIGAKKVTLALPEGSVTFLCRNEFARIRTDDNRHNNMPLGRGELEVSPDDSAKIGCAIEVTGPPEIHDPRNDIRGGADADQIGQDGVLIK